MSDELREIILTGTVDEFLFNVRFLPTSYLKDETILSMINKRLDRMNLTFDWGCCGQNTIKEKTK